MRAKVLLVEDSTSLAILYKQYVKDEPYDIFHVETGRDAIQFIERNTPQLVILDLKLPDMSGEDVLDWINQNDVPTAVIIATAHGSVDIAVSLMNKGAEDFLEKPIKADRLKTSIAVHLKRAKLEHLVENIQSRFDRPRYHGFIGACLPMQAVYKTIDSVAPTTASVFINGESGTGKEVCAEAIHKQSLRKDQPFIAINCGAIPRDLMESEIFGHLKGAFTGATTDRKGAAMLANGGTLFLDELCEMELEMQKKLLRFLQTGTFTPLGGSKEIKVDVRIICATNRDPLKEVEEGRFREDLYYRVHVVPIEMPPLRERGNDIVELANHFLKTYAKEDGKKFNSISKEAQSILKKYNWPGNVRQLQNIIRNIVVLNDDNQLNMEHLPAQLTTKPQTVKEPAKLSTPPQPVQAVIQEMRNGHEALNHHSLETQTSKANPLAHNAFHHSDGSIRPMWQIEREAIQNAIAFCDGNVISAAVMLELSPSTVYRKKQAWEAEENA
ncbi:sigma-54-dependent Fis family transcriptional regulator [Vibrio vulnificus]|jgi:two-component system repressor protein LuxO|uniref:sigma-54-dependent transcriptional regulator n=1 Tax=Vibrio vulnificus TaxID=672 RepID=UPI0005056902|nr:sigma-54 dependent transcriptional regulator [Vibrio vulnificus]EGQ7758280.1 sigma-54-dependent Fis family transcriptional regulator [Vibrio vulnificus]EGQ7991231.1 sigma-54-dependent Fis family transcriptional regulator [Vibrio vulnificus]EGQ9282987.1 sigma-54-dependent Fis family transcriptional regulator [Vibrio vulnificus]EGR1511084.1 sigma-54-dependent Fis family transcriptional regulator [Vibrio vulnificus]EGR1892754.1 sigma-54-dependent Fis family transcriptional regulator [Vibrio vu